MYSIYNRRISPHCSPSLGYTQIKSHDIGRRGHSRSLAAVQWLKANSPLDPSHLPAADFPTKINDILFLKFMSSKIIPTVFAAITSLNDVFLKIKKHQYILHYTTFWYEEICFFTFKLQLIQELQFIQK